MDNLLTFDSVCEYLEIKTDGMGTKSITAQFEGVRLNRTCIASELAARNSGGIPKVLQGMWKESQEIVDSMRSVKMAIMPSVFSGLTPAQLQEITGQAE